METTAIMVIRALSMISGHRSRSPFADPAAVGLVAVGWLLLAVGCSYDPPTSDGRCSPGDDPPKPGLVCVDGFWVESDTSAGDVSAVDSAERDTGKPGDTEAPDAEVDVSTSDDVSDSGPDADGAGAGDALDVDADAPTDTGDVAPGDTHDGADGDATQIVEKHCTKDSPDEECVCESGETCEIRCDGTGAGSDVTCRCKAGARCDITCTEGPCDMQCDDGAERCDLTCDNSGGDGCKATCKTDLEKMPGEPACQITCAGDDACQPTCGADARCEIDCTGDGNCNPECQDGSTCKAVCNGGGDCSPTCGAGASSCEFRCGESNLIGSCHPTCANTGDDSRCHVECRYPSDSACATTCPNIDADNVDCENQFDLCDMTCEGSNNYQDFDSNDGHCTRACTDD